MRIQNLEKKVFAVLSSVPQTRNSDIELTIEIWRRYYSKYIIVSSVSGVEAVRLRDLFELPREDNVKRVRAHIQNDLGKFLPTDWAVARQRKINEQTWRVYMNQFHPNTHI